MNKLDYTIVFVSEMGRSVTFYGDTLGLPLRFESPKWSEFATEGCTLALHHTPEMAPDARRWPIPAGQCHPGFQVPDLDAFHKQMLSKSVKCLQPPKEEGFGVKLAVYADPDGLPISIAELKAG
jgi:lactoylglutathione lyase